MARPQPTTNRRSVVAAIPSTQSGRCRGRPRSPCSGGIASTNARASCESFRFAPVRRTASGTPRPSQIDQYGHHHALRGWNSCPRPLATNQSDPFERANPAARSESDPTRPLVANRAGGANTSSPNRTRVPAGASAKGCRCGGRTKCRSDTRDPKCAAVRPSADVVQWARTVRLDHNGSGSSAAAIPVHATSPARIRFRRFCYLLLGQHWAGSRYRCFSAERPVNRAIQAGRATGSPISRQ